MSAAKRKRGVRVGRPKPSSKRNRAKPAQVALRSRTHAPAKAKSRPTPKAAAPARKPVSKPAKPAAKPAPSAAKAASPAAKPSPKPVAKPVASAKPDVPGKTPATGPRPAALEVKKPKVIQPHQESPKDTPAPRPAAKTPAPKKPKPPAKTMQVPPPSTAPLLMLGLPDVRRATAPRTRGIDLSRGHLRPEPASKSKETDDEDGPVDASLIMSSLAIDAAPKIEDNYDYTVLDEFRSSKHCPAPTRVVNTGCGGGEAAVYFAKLGYKVVGIDSDRMAVGLARERAWLAGQDVDFMVGDLFETPNLLPAESFGLAIDRGAFYRLEDDRDRQRYLSNIKRLLFQGGVLLLSAGFFPLDDKTNGSGKKPPKGGTKLLLAREGGVVVNELRQAGFDLMHRVLRRTADSGDYGELLLYLKK